MITTIEKQLFRDIKQRIPVFARYSDCEIHDLFRYPNYIGEEWLKSKKDERRLMGLYIIATTPVRANGSSQKYYLFEGIMNDFDGIYEVTGTSSMNGNPMNGNPMNGNPMNGNPMNGNLHSFNVKMFPLEMRSTIKRAYMESETLSANIVVSKGIVSSASNNFGEYFVHHADNNRVYDLSTGALAYKDVYGIMQSYYEENIKKFEVNTMELRKRQSLRRRERMLMQD
jgi:hypothetical protein